MLKKVRIFDSLRFPAFRFFFASLTISSISGGMQDPLTSWLVLNLTDSPFIYGIVMSLRFVPYLIGPMVGVLSDRVSRRKLLIIFKATQIVFALTLGTLIVGGQIQLWHVAVIILLQSTINTLNFPAQSAYIVDLVGGENITNATAVDRLFMDETSLFGSFLVAALVDSVGVGTFFYLNAVIYFAALIPLFFIRGVTETRNTGQGTMFRDLIDGFKYSWRVRPVFGGQLIYFITNLFPIATKRSLMWIYAKNVINADASGLGWLSTGSKLGDFIATIAMAQLGNMKGKGKIVVFSCIGWGTIWILFSTTTSLALASTYLVVEGMMSAFTMVLAQVILLINTEPNMRGRVMGIRSFAISSQFPGSVIAGAMAEAWGETLAVSLEGGLFVISMLLILKMMPSLRKTD